MIEQDLKRIIQLSDWEGVTLLDEEAVKTENGTRSFMTFGGRKGIHDCSRTCSTT